MSVQLREEELQLQKNVMEMPQEIRIGMIGSVDSGKSTITGVLVNSELDDGRGKARSKILKHPHEKDTGRSSSITQNYLKLNKEKDNAVANKNNGKIIDFVDLAGHEKYLTTTISGLKKCIIDHAAVMIGANMGVLHMTRKHLKLAMALNLPIFVVLTKIDIAPENIKNNTITTIKKIMEKLSRKRIVKLIENENDLDKLDDSKLNVPIFPVSSVTGDGINVLRRYIYGLDSHTLRYEKHNNDVEFIIDSSSLYNIKGIGIVISGIVYSGTINLNDSLYLGPINNNFVKVIVKSMHDNFKTNVNVLYAGQGGCLNIKAATKNTFKKNQIKKGTQLLSNPILYSYFDANVKILEHPTTVKIGYEPVIHIGNILQTAKIIKIIKENNDCGDDGENYLRLGDKALVTFRFSYHSECINIGDDLMLREGDTKGIGKIVKVFNEPE